MRFEGGGYEATYPPWRLTREELALLYEPFRARIRAARELLRSVSPELAEIEIPQRSLRERAEGMGSRTKGWMLARPARSPRLRPPAGRPGN